MREFLIILMTVFIIMGFVLSFIRREHISDSEVMSNSFIGGLIILGASIIITLILSNVIYP